MRIPRTPRDIYIAITARCNLKCPYCAHFTSPGDVDDLPSQEWHIFFEELNRCAVMNVTFEGGEPFYREDFKEIIQGVVRNRMRFTILSNGTLFTEELIRFIAATKRCNRIQISIDGACASTHEATRGFATFKKAVNAITLLKQYQIPVTVRVTINRYNVYELHHIARFLLEELQLDSFGTNSAYYGGLCRHNASQMRLTVEERSCAMKELVRLNKKYCGRISAMAGPLAEAYTWNRILKRKRQLISVPGNTTGRLTACGGAYRELAVRADGTMTPCTLLSHIALGRINRDSLQEIWQGHPELIRLRTRRFVSLEKFNFCNDCAFIQDCHGSCPAVAYNFSGNEDTPIADSCLKRFLDAGGIVPECM